MVEVAASPLFSDEHSLEQFSHLLSKEEIKNYSRLDNIKFLVAVISEIVTIALAVWVSEAFWNPFIYLFSVVIIGSRIHAITILMHDAAHYRGLSNRKWNEFLGEILALFIPFAMQGYRNNHFAHHRELNSKKDPDWIRTRIPEFAYPKRKSVIILLLCQYAIGLKTLKEMRMARKDLNDISPRLKLARNIFYILLGVLSVALGFWKPLILYWIVPSATSFMFFLYIRSVAEHYTNLEYQHVLNHTRTVIAPFWERWLFAPYGINYHIEHHLYPSVPFYRLSKLHHYLMTKSVFAQSAHLTHGYVTGLFRESIK